MVFWYYFTNKFIVKRELGIVLYQKPSKNQLDQAFTKTEINLFLCTSAYR